MAVNDSPTLFLAHTKREQPTPFVLFLCNKMNENSIEETMCSLLRIYSNVHYIFLQIHNQKIYHIRSLSRK